MIKVFHITIKEVQMEVKGVSLRLGEYRKTATDAEKNVIDFALKHPDEAIGKSIHELAAMTYTSASSIVRLCRKLGCGGYRQFQQGLVYEQALSRKTRRTVLDGITTDDTTTDIIRKVTQKNVASLEATEQLLNKDSVDACVKLLKRCRVVNLFGIGASLLVARDFQLKLLRVDKPCNLSGDWHTQLLYAKNMRPSDLAVAISYSGLTKEVVTCAKTAKENGATVIAITRNSPGTDLVRYADRTLSVAATELITRSGAMSSRISQLNVVDVLYASYVSDNYEQCMNIFEKNRISKESEKGR
jgi:DNA-binding MurR/RpiR family transcriptional regulator